MPSLRTYSTNLAFQATYDSLWKKYSIPDASKGNVTFHVLAFPNAVQITAGGFVKIHGSNVENDEQILKILASDVKTLDSQVFNWVLHSRTKGEKELLKDRDLEAQKRLLTLFLDKLESELQSLGIDSGYEVDIGRELLTTMRPQVDNMDSESISQSLPEVQEAIDRLYDVKLNLDPSTWYVPEGPG